MVKNYPEYLKLHVEDQASSGAMTGPQPPQVRGLDAIVGSLETIGWRLECRELDDTPDSTGWSMTLRDGTEESKQLVLTPAETARDATPLERVQPIAQAIGLLVDELLEAHGAIWQREAELAAGIPVTVREEDRRALAQRLEAVLRGGAEAIGCQAAALYLLDDATSYLKLRAAWQLPTSRFWDEPRPLRGSVADLEALVGHAVALEDTALLPHWKAPEDFPSALCVPISTNSTPLGTLWFFGDSVREYTAEQVQMVEIVAGRLVADLEREVLMRESLRTRNTDVTHQSLVNLQDELRPRVPPLVDGWQVAACNGQQEAIATQFYDWRILPDGRIAVALGHAEGRQVEAGLTSTMLQIAFCSHAAHPHESRQMLDLLNESLWTHSTGNRFASLSYAMIDPDTGEMQYASAGENHMLVHDAQTLDTLTDGNPTLGFDPDHPYRQATRRIEIGQSLVFFSRGVVSPLDEELRDPDECQIAELLQTMENATAEEQVRAVAAKLEAVDALHKRTVVVVRRVF